MAINLLFNASSSLYRAGGFPLASRGTEDIHTLPLLDDAMDPVVCSETDPVEFDDVPFSFSTVPMVESASVWSVRTTELSSVDDIAMFVISIVGIEDSHLSVLCHSPRVI